MYVFFADDSKQHGFRKGMGDLISFGGYLLEERSIRPLANDVDQILESLKVPLNTEIKWSLPPGNWIREKLSEEERASLYSHVLDTLQSHDATALVAIWDCGRTSLDGDDAFDKCIDFVFERISIHLSRVNAYCLIVADRPGGGKKQEDELIAGFVGRLESGTDYVPPDSVLLNLLTAPSKLIRHLQIADLITSISTAMVAKKYSYAKEPFERIKKMMMMNTSGYIGGTGLKLFPDQLINLYYWILGEDSYIRVSMNTAWPLPLKQYPYHLTENGSDIPF
ncbi:MAG: hypothetical protein JSV37_10255 [Anaerolineaceae bacterium]|nr:MAG: hypothetical protein JSV37_10255 [Anaerolineaceae bacterium]